MLENRELAGKYVNLDAFSNPVKPPAREIVGRQNEMNAVLSALMRPELSNVILIGEAGSGKTALVQGVSQMDKERLYLEVDLAKMIADIPDTNQMAARLKELFDEVARYVQENKRKIVLFMDEFHQVVQLSAVAVEALKPLLADSGTRGICVICATTETEFKKYIAPNQPLVERLQRININQPDKETTILILKNMAKKYGVDHYFYNDGIYEKIYEYTERYVPANSQPRKSILVLDAMCGWHNAFGVKLDTKLLSKVIYESEGVNVAFTVDAVNIKQYLDSKVFAQELASSQIESRLQICCADLNNKDKPMSSFLFCGSTGVGKMLPNRVPIPVYDSSGKVTRKRNGDLQVGDYVFDRMGNPTKVIGVFPKGMQDVYEVEFSDGRRLRAGDKHLWTYRSSSGNGAAKWRVANTLELMSIVENDSSRIKCVIPMNQAVKWQTAAGSVSDWYEIGRQCAVSENFNSVALNKGSVKQRMALIRGLFDVHGKLSGPNRRYELIYSAMNESILVSIQTVLWSLGFSSKITSNLSAKRPYMLRVKCSMEDKKKFFLKNKEQLSLVDEAIAYDASHPKKRQIDYSILGIRAIRKLDEREEMTCISVDNKEQLYQAGDFIVTHNTEMTKQLAHILFNDERNLLRFDMTEYANPDSLDRFRRELTAKVWFKPYSIILLDEIEKACAPVTRILLQVLDDGRLIDENNREVSFCNAYIVLTTNAGSEVFKNISQYNESDTGDGSTMKNYMKLIRNSISQTTGDNRFPPELLGRIDTIVPFQPLSEATMKKIVSAKLQKLCTSVKNKHNVRLKISPDVIRFLVEDNLDTDSNSGGARIVVSKMEETVVTEVSRYINSHPDVEQIIVKVEGTMAADNKMLRESAAHIKVQGVKNK